MPLLIAWTWATAAFSAGLAFSAGFCGELHENKTTAAIRNKEDFIIWFL
jgi:hypothetical protein